MLREVVVDTGTTGLDVANGDRVIEISCVEIVVPTLSLSEWQRITFGFFANARLSSLTA